MNKPKTQGEEIVDPDRFCGKFSLKKIAECRYHNGTGYQEFHPPGGKTDALCETIISWEVKGKTVKTRGLDSDQTVSAIQATQKMLNLL